MTNLLRKGWAGVAVGTDVLAAAFTLALVILVLANVVARYAFSTGLDWADELTRLAFMWVVFLGAFVALRRGAHLSLTALVDRLPLRARSIVLLVGELLAAAFLGYLVYGSVGLLQQALEFDTRSPILGISVAWSYLPLTVSSALMLVHVLGQVITATQNLLRGTDPAPDGEEVVPT